MIKDDALRACFGLECIASNKVVQRDDAKVIVYGIIGKDVWKTWWMGWREAEDDNIRKKGYAMDIVNTKKVSVFVEVT